MDYWCYVVLGVTLGVIWDHFGSFWGPLCVLVCGICWDTLKIKNNDAFLRLKKIIGGANDNSELDPEWKTLHKDAFELFIPK